MVESWTIFENVAIVPYTYSICSGPCLGAFTYLC